ncbi:winged helix-turn-helix transcriptional regulator [Hoeflea sp. TYP-13]|uniref:winged helix-turn-helix transcriptional regulator n=1 Tax=Hoeflea sp. TYP-13 TaxID=3230023 RepID=UPI0034C6A28E
MALFDLLGRNWSMGILWNLSQGSPCSFRDLRDRCEMVSPTVLNERLKELREAGLVETTEDGYRVTPLGQELYRHLVPMKNWASRWAREINRREK